MNKKAPVVDKNLLSGQKKIGFVCFGNICRSPFAYAYAAKKWPSQKFYSYGLFTEPDRLPPINAVIAASESGIDINEHRASVLDQKRVDELDVVIFMDTLTYQKGINIFPASKSKIFKLSAEDIQDPYGSDLKNFERVYQSIKRHLDSLFG